MVRSHQDFRRLHAPSEAGAQAGRCVLSGLPLRTGQQPWANAEPTIVHRAHAIRIALHCASLRHVCPTDAALITDAGKRFEGLKAGRTAGFCNRATHNLWTLLDEARQIDEHLAAGPYVDWYPSHLDNSIYRPLIDRLVEYVQRAGASQSRRAIGTW